MMKSEKGVTLTALVVYMIVFMIVLSIMSTISAHFYKNIAGIKNSPQYIAEFNKFSMFFVADVKKNNEINTITDTTLEFADGTSYRYENGSIYRNDKKIARYVKSFKFTQDSYKVNSTIKNIVNVNTTLGNKNENMTRNIDFVLKYW